MKINVSKKSASITPSGIREFFDLVLGMEDIISLGIGEPDFVTPWNICEAGIYALEKGYTSYTSNQGLLSFRKTIAQYLKKKYNLGYHPEKEILITVGTSEAYDLAIRALINPSDEVLIPEPSYVSYYSVTQLAGGKPKYLSTHETGFKVTPKMLQEAISNKTKILLLNYPSNPTGITYTVNELKNIAKIVKANNLIVISDEIYGDLTYDFQHTPFASISGMQSHTVYINGFSKAYAMTGWRVGYACGPENVIDAMNRIHQYTMLCAPIMSQMAAQEALINGDNACLEMKKEYKRRREYVISRLGEMGFTFPYPAGAFYIFASVKNTGLTGKEFSCRLLKEKKVAVVPGVAFGTEFKNKYYIRVCYTTEFEKLKKALNKIEQFLKEL
ncbi:MAG: aminotransferase class I/II-fold pyridoxal phosphate-dependent enzyme [Candidatus Saelkia tenebricola]|nr:aminotransferase class I/II-fold pyridoxal phosphate-dependent enzyme [Candidatus Saelkia tenebricola]